MAEITERTRQQLMPHEHHGSEQECSDRQCNRGIGGSQWSRTCFLDLLNGGRLLCDLCGKSLRYARKKAVERGEPIESATQTL